MSGGGVLLRAPVFASILGACLAEPTAPGTHDTATAPDTAGHTGDTAPDTARDTAPTDTDTAGDTAADPAQPPLSLAPVWQGEGLATKDRYGFSVASAGDVNGDGFDEVLVGVRNSHLDWLLEGAVYLHAGGPGGPSPSPSWELRGGVPEAFLGEAVAGVGDVNGDGFDDVVVAAANHPTESGGNGRVYLFRGSAGGLQTEPDWTYDSENQGSWLGRSVAGAGDVNGDGYADVLIGEKYYGSALRPAEGRVHLFFGSLAGLRPDPDWTYASGQAGAMLGFSVAGAGDVNADGFADVIVGAAFWDGAAPEEGTAWVFHGSPFGLGRAPSWSAEPAGPNSLCGYPVSSAGDVNGDGYDDVVMGCISHTGTHPAEGMVRLYHGSATGLAGAAWERFGQQEGAHLGQAVSGGCDVDADGYDDVLVAASGVSNGHEGEGAASLHRGGPGGPDPTAAWSWEPDLAAAGLANASACAGDVDGDGVDDVILGAIGWSGAGAESGAAWVFTGQRR